VSITDIALAAKIAKVALFACMIDDAPVAKNVEEAQSVSIIESALAAEIAMVALFACMTHGAPVAESVEEAQFVSITEKGPSARTAKVVLCAKHTIDDAKDVTIVIRTQQYFAIVTENPGTMFVQLWAMQNMMGFALIALLIYFPTTRAVKPFEPRAKSWRLSRK